jgi:hypothetical protein
MSHDKPAQPKLADLLVGYLNRRADDSPSDADAEVVPYEAGPVHPVDARLAWDETLLVARCFAPDLKTQDSKAPPSWGGLVAAHEPAVAVACAVGNFPQMVRHFHSILQSRDLGQLRPGNGPARPSAAPAVVDWARERIRSAARSSQGLEMLTALGTLRLAKEFAEAEKLFLAHDADVPAPWRIAWDNEKAALMWHRGLAQQASDLWQKLEPNPVILFNRGMSDLFLDRLAEAQVSLKAAVARLPEEGAWHHLGRLYLTLAQSR